MTVWISSCLINKLCFPVLLHKAQVFSISSLNASKGVNPTMGPHVEGDANFHHPRVHQKIKSISKIFNHIFMYSCIIYMYMIQLYTAVHEYMIEYFRYWSYFFTLYVLFSFCTYFCVKILSKLDGNFLRQKVILEVNPARQSQIS